MVYKQRAFLLDCDGQHGEAVAQMRRGRALAEAEAPRQHLDEVLRHRLFIQRALASRNASRLLGAGVRLCNDHRG